MTHTSITLQQAIAQCYAEFAHYHAPQVNELNVCLTCCMPMNVAEEMCHLPLRQISAKHIWEYNSSAKSSPEYANQYKYFLPRILELLAQGEELALDNGWILGRLRKCPPDSFTVSEQLVINQFCQAYFADFLNHFPWQTSSRFYDESAFGLLYLLENPFWDADALLMTWQQNDSPQATLQFVNSVSDYAWCREHTHPLAKKIDDWLQQHRLLFAQRILALDTDQIDGFTQWQTWNKWLTSHELLGYIFDMIS